MKSTPFIGRRAFATAALSLAGAFATVNALTFLQTLTGAPKLDRNNPIQTLGAFGRAAGESMIKAGAVMNRQYAAIFETGREKGPRP